MQIENTIISYIHLMYVPTRCNVSSSYECTKSLYKIIF